MRRYVLAYPSGMPTVVFGLALGVILLVLGVMTTSHWWSVGLFGVGASFIVEAALRARRHRASAG
jgi:hypothetical protein